MKQSKGFTIIELLVVVAIISVLAAIVLVNITGYINKGKNAAIKSNLGTVLTNAAVHFDVNGNYTTFSASSGYANPAASAVTANGGTVLTFGLNTTTNTSFCTCSVIRTTTDESGTFCVDSTGYKAVTATACTTRCTNGAGGTNGECQP